VLPAQFSDRKDSTDVVVDFGDGVALAIDAATEQDLNGYELPSWADASSEKKQSKGIHEKMRKSYQVLTNDYGNMLRVQYAGKPGEVRTIDNMPRVVLGASQAAIGMAAKEWARDPQNFDPSTQPLFTQMKRSAARQLISQIPLARAEEERIKKDKKGKKVNAESAQLEKVLKVLNEKAGGRGAGAGEGQIDPVIERINKEVSNRNTREHLIAEAKREQQGFHKLQGFISRERGGKPELVNAVAPLTQIEEAGLHMHIKNNVDPAERDSAQKALDTYLAADPATNPVFPAALLGAVAGGVPTRLFTRLRASSEVPPVVPLVPPVTPPVVPPAEPVLPVHSHEPVLPHSDVPPAPASTHLAAIAVQGGKFETSWGRWKSRFKNGLLHSLGAAFAYGTAQVAKLALIGLGVGSVAGLVVSALAGYGAFYGAYKFMQKKKWYDDAWEREKTRGIQKVEALKVSRPAEYARLKADPVAYDKAVKWYKMQGIIGGYVAGFAASGLAGGLNAHYQTNGQIWGILANGESLSTKLAQVAAAYAPAGSGRAGVVAGAPGAGAVASMAQTPASASTGFKGLTTDPSQLTNSGGQNRGGGIRFVDTAPHPVNLPDGHPAKHFKSKTFLVDFGSPRSQGIAAPITAHEAAMARQTPGGFMGLRAQEHANSPMIARYGSGHWNPTTRPTGSLGQSLGLPTRW
jgi:hypothetical protein